MKRFLYDGCGLLPDWTPTNIVDEQVHRIREQVGDAKVICGLSGGVDSSVAAVLIHEAIGEQLTCVFVDTGLLRQDEAKQVVTMFRDHYNIPLVQSHQPQASHPPARAHHLVAAHHSWAAQLAYQPAEPA